jgi:hypothetical protein
MCAVIAGPALASGRMHSSGTGLAEPDPDASYAAIALARPSAVSDAKAIASVMLSLRGERVPDAG